MYIKVCKNPRCRKAFESESRNQAYCSIECQKAYYHERKLRRDKYRATQIESALMSKAYRLAQEVADLFYPEKVCSHCGEPATHVHHKDLNPLNNDPHNLDRCCDKCHKKEHSNLPTVNMIDTLSLCIAADSSEARMRIFEIRLSGE